MNKPMVAQEIWQSIHSVYGDQLGLTSDDEDYIDPTNDKVDALVSADANDSEKPESKSTKSSKSENTKSTAAADNQEKSDESDNDKFVLSRDSGDLIDFASSSATTSGTGTVAMNTTVTKPKMRIIRSKAELLTNENIPTDASDSTDSDDENSVPFVCTAECTSMHEGRQVVHTILPINVDNLMNLLFSKSKFFAEFHKMRKTTNMVYRDWVTEDGLKTRTMNFTVAVTQAVGPKTSNVSGVRIELAQKWNHFSLLLDGQVTEFQTMRECSLPGQLYSIDITSVNAGVPYADSFQVLFHYCLVRWVSEIGWGIDHIFYVRNPLNSRTVDDHTMLSVYAQIKYVKSVWGVVKGFIEKNIWCGLEDFFKALLNALQSEYCIPPAKSKSRRSKRGKRSTVFHILHSLYWATFHLPYAAMTQKASSEDAPVKAKFAPTVTTHVIPSDSTPPIAATKLTSQITKSSSLPIVESPSTKLRSNIFAEHFSFLIAVLVIALLLLNIYLIAKLYTLETSDSIHLVKTPSSSSAGGGVQHNGMPITR